MAKLPNKPEPSNKPLPKTINVEDLSPGTVEVLEHFGVEAPTLLNDYCCALEDALIEQVEKRQKYQQLTKVLLALLKEHGINTPLDKTNADSTD